MLKRDKKNGFKISILLTIVAISILSCMKFQHHSINVDPIKITVIDQSRVDNIKIRHIFKEMLLKEIVTQNIDWLMVYTSDTGIIDYII
jgi:hypothetical protein